MTDEVTRATTLALVRGGVGLTDEVTRSTTLALSMEEWDLIDRDMDRPLGFHFQDENGV
jgi:hypothetical protein